jgi:hypothetical protein
MYPENLQRQRLLIFACSPLADDRDVETDKNKECSFTGAFVLIWQ